MGQNKKLLENMRQLELSKESLISMYEREMYHLAQPNQKEQINNSISTMLFTEQ